MKLLPTKIADNDPRITLGLPPSGNANFMWIQHFMHHLAPNGQAGFVMPNGALAVSGKEGDLRQKLIEQDLVDVIISCPSKLFYNVSLPVSLWFLSKNKGGDRFRNRKGEILFIDARDTFEQISRKQVIFTKEHVEKITNTVRAWHGEKGVGKYEDMSGFCKSATLEEVKKNGYVLTPGRYVGLADVEDDGISFEERMQKLSSELREAFVKGRDLEKQIENNLKELGF
jgi:type I restriction enzyme M protein